MLQVTEEACRVSKGLVLWVAAGVTRKWNYWPCCEGLMWEWFKRGNQQWRPAFWHRVGIPGSGGKQWLRADIEYVMAFTSCKAAVPFADNTANGHPPKWAPGGEMSHRLSDGARVNQWGHSFDTGGTSVDPNGVPRSRGWPRRANGKMKAVARDGKQITRRISQGHGPDGDTRQDDVYVPPVLANPGVLVEPKLTLAELVSILKVYEQHTSSPADQVLRELRQADSANRLREWFYGVCLKIRASEVLQYSMRNPSIQKDNSSEAMPVVRKDNGAKGDGSDDGFSREEVLQPQMLRKDSSETGRPEARRTSAQRTEDSATDDATDNLREMRTDESTSHSSSGRERHKQRAGQSSSSVPLVPSTGTQDRELQSRELYQSARITGLLQQALPALQEVWQSACEMLWARQADDTSSLIRNIKVGGGFMGHKCAHLNEAPFPEKLASWFIKSFCPPGGRVLDPFSGSGTTVAAATKLGRVGIGCDLRLSQCQLGKRRCQEVQKDLFV